MPQSHKRFVAFMLSESSEGGTAGVSAETFSPGNGHPRAVNHGFDSQSGSRNVTTEWLMEQLLDDEGVADIPITLRNAVVVGTDKVPKLDLSGTVFKGRVSITESVFECEVNFSFAVFEQSVDFTGSRFTKGIDMRAARAKCDLWLTRARFDQYACFDDLYVGEAFRAEGADFREVDFNRLRLAKNALFCGALVAAGESGYRLLRTRFRDRADFTDAHVEGSAYFRGAWFAGRAIFDRVHIDGSAFFNCDLYSGREDGEDAQSDNLQFRRRPAEQAPADAGRGRRLRLRVILFGGKVSFVGARFGGSVSFAGAQFRDVADFRRVRIEGTAIFEHFASSAGGRPVFIPVCFAGEARFWMLSVGGAAQFHAVHFHGNADFEHAQIGGRAYFDAVSYGGGVVSPRFDKEVKFMGAHVKGTCVFVGAIFNADAVFQHFHTDMSVLARTAEYRKEKDVAAQLAAKLAAQAAAGTAPGRNWEDALKEVTREQARETAARYGTPGALRRIRETTPAVIFHGKADFLAVRIRGNAEFDGAHFVGYANFERAQVGGALHFRPEQADTEPVCFHGPVNFQGAAVKGNAQFSGTKFRDRAEFKAMLFEGGAYFDRRLHYEDGRPADGDDMRPSPQIISGGVRFHGPVHFSGARFKNQANFAGALFDRAAHFTNTVVEGTALFQGAVFEGATSFRGAHFNIVRFRESSAAASAANTASPAAASAAGAAPPAAAADKWFRAWVGRQRVRLAAALAVRAERSAVPLRTSFGTRACLDLRGFTYQQIEVKFEDIMRGMDGSNRAIPFERQPYVQLEKTYRAGGDEYRAGDVYHRLRWREHREGWRKSRRNGWRLIHDIVAKSEEKKSFPSIIRRGAREAGRVIGLLFDLVFLGGLARYGIRPFRLNLISIAILCAGTYFFSQPGAVALKSPAPTEREAVPQQPTPTPEPDLSRSQAFGVSLNQFIPIIEVPSGGRWRPSEKLMRVPFTDAQCNPATGTDGGCRFNHLSYAFYGTIHRLSGFILVPLGLAALTGLLHRREGSSSKR